MKNPPKKPIPPPSRLMRQTLFSGFIETQESKRRTQAWRDGKCEGCIYKTSPCTCK